MPQMIGVKSEFDMRMVKFRNDFQRTLECRKKSPFLSTRRVHRLNCKIDRLFLGNGRQRSEGADKQPAGVTAGMASATATVENQSRAADKTGHADRGCCILKTFLIAAAITPGKAASP